MMYAERYTADELHDMFANEVDNQTIVDWDADQMATQLQELAPDMTDAKAVAEAIKTNARRNLEG